MPSFLKILVGALLALTAHVAKSESKTFTFTEQNNQVTWTAIGNPDFVRITGEGGSAKGQITLQDKQLSGELLVGLAPYKTGIASRDKHMHEKYLKTAQHPEAKLVLSHVPFDESKTFPWNGTLTLKDNTQTVTGTASWQAGVLKASFVLKITAFPSLDVPKYLGITMADDVEVNLVSTGSLEAKP